MRRLISYSSRRWRRTFRRKQRDTHIYTNCEGNRMQLLQLHCQS